MKMHGEPMNYSLLALLFVFAIPSMLSADDKFVGEWEGKYDTPIYTKLIIHDDQNLTYCDVMSCRQIDCFKMTGSGSLKSLFTYEDASGKWEFHRINDEEFEATFTNAAGDISNAWYEPE